MSDENDNNLACASIIYVVFFALVILFIISRYNDKKAIRYPWFPKHTNTIILNHENDK